MSWILFIVLNVSIINSIRQNQICEEMSFFFNSANEALVAKRQMSSSAAQALVNLQPMERSVELSTMQHCSMCRAQAQGNRKLVPELKNLMYFEVTSGLQ